MMYSPAVIFSLAAFVGNFGIALTGFGMAIFFLTIYTIADFAGSMDCDRCDIKDAVFYQTIALGAAIPVLLYQCRDIKEYLNRKLLLTLIPTTAAGTPLGNFSQEHLPNDIFRLVIGILITFALTNSLRKLIPETECWKKLASKNNRTTNESNKEVDAKMNEDGNAEGKLEKDEEKTLTAATNQQRNDVNDVDFLTGNEMIFWGIVAGLCSGFLGGLAGIRGPPMMIFFLSFPFPKHTVRANSIILMSVNVLIRICYYIIEDVSSSRKRSWFEADLWYVYLSVMLLGVFGVPLGNWVAQRINQNQFKLVIAFMLFLSGVSNIIKGSIQISQRRK